MTMKTPLALTIGAALLGLSIGVTDAKAELLNCIPGIGHGRYWREITSLQFLIGFWQREDGTVVQEKGAAIFTDVNGDIKSNSGIRRPSRFTYVGEASIEAETLENILEGGVHSPLVRVKLS